MQIKKVKLTQNFSVSFKDCNCCLLKLTWNIPTVLEGNKKQTKKKGSLIKQ